MDDFIKAQRVWDWWVFSGFGIEGGINPRAEGAEVVVDCAALL